MSPVQEHSSTRLQVAEIFKRPPAWLSLIATLIVIGIVAYIRLVPFEGQVISLGYGLPLLLALWHRDRLQLYFMAGMFTLLSSVKFFIVLPHAHHALDAV